ncbi:MAG: class I SAM-dependent methyltransferase [Bacteroidetes bacterium]|nr:MAG: class I SAM-dependent methyltransferase [Bacteroidota bacterium]
MNIQPLSSDFWFARWFDSPYYARLYGHRDEAEARAFVSHLTTQLALPQGAAVLDLACGNGRHAEALHAQGLRVWGYDLSPTQLSQAQERTAPGLQFRRHDMRTPFPDRGFSAVFNLFTSFGYFQTDAEHRGVLDHIHAALIPGGHLVMDYFNLSYIRQNLVPEEEKNLDGVHFLIKRRIQKGSIIKDIHIQDGHLHSFFSERVRAYTPEALEALLQRQGFGVTHRWGTYAGDRFHPEKSPRLILFARREN